MHKLMLIFHKPDDPLAFETEWSETFVRKAEAMPGLRRVAVVRVVGSPGQAVDLHLIHEFYFDDLESLQAALASPKGQAAAQALMAFAADHVTVAFAEHLEEKR